MCWHKLIGLLARRAYEAQAFIGAGRRILKTILHIITGLERGGAETVLSRMISGLRRYRHVVVSLGTRGPLAASIEQAGGRVEALQLNRPLGAIKATHRLRQLIRETRPDLVQSWLVHANVLSALTRWTLAPTIPLLWNVRQSLDALEKEKWLTRQIISASPLLAHTPAAIVYNSTHAALRHEKIGYPPAKREIIPNGFDTQQFAPCPATRYAVRQEFGIPAKALVIGLVGRFHPVKNHEAFLEAAAQVLDTEPDAHFLLAGEGTEKERMLPLIGNSALQERLTGLGARSDIARITCSLDIACNVSHSEAFPNSIGEAMACGVPCVVTPVGDSPVIVGNTGLITEDTSEVSISSALLRMIGLGPRARADLGSRARQRIERNYSLRSVILRYEELYERLFANPARNSRRNPVQRG